MATVDLDGKQYDVDEDGFLRNPEEWNKEVAAALAALEGVSELTDDHWKVMNYLRDYYDQNGIAPMVRKVTKECGIKLKGIYDLFPQGPANSACKWAGLPKPTGCV